MEQGEELVLNDELSYQFSRSKFLESCVITYSFITGSKEANTLIN